MTHLTTHNRPSRFQFTEETGKSARPTSAASAEHVADKPARGARTALLVGFDWGTNKSCIQAARAGAEEMLANHTVPTVVGYANEGIVEGLLPGNARVLFGQDALKYRLHLRLVQPMVDGVIHDVAASRDFAEHLRSRLDVPEHEEIRAVIGVPANADATAREHVRNAVSGLFTKVILIPEPFLAAMGYRDEARLADAGYSDPVRNSLFVDIGGGTTDVCMIQGCFPTADDQISFAFAGDRVDALLEEGIRRTYPDAALSRLKVRELKEKHAFVGQPEAPVVVTVLVGGKPRKLDITEQLNAACTALLERIYETVTALIARASSDSVEEMLQNIVLTGGGSCIRHIDKELQRRLAEEGYENPCVRLVGAHYKEFVAKGALKAARQARENQWQQLIG